MQKCAGGLVLDKWGNSSPKTTWLDTEMKMGQEPAQHTHTHPFNGHFSGTTQVSRYQKG